MLDLSSMETESFSRNYKRWSDDELDIIRKFHPAVGGTWEDLLSKLPGRKENNVVATSMKLGLRLKRSQRSVPTKRGWSPEESELLTNLWEETASVDLCKRFKREWREIYNEARRLGLRIGVPRGMTSLPQAARKLGVNVSSAAILCGAYLLKVSRVNSVNGRGRCRYVDYTEIEECYREWITLESIFSASQRKNVPYESLRRACEKAGLMGDIRNQGVARMFPPDLFDLVHERNGSLTEDEISSWVKPLQLKIKDYKSGHGNFKKPVQLPCGVYRRCKNMTIFIGDSL